MKKKGINRLVLVTVILIWAMALSGCGKKATPENLLTDVNKNLENVKSVTGLQKAEVTLEEAGMEGTVEIEMELSATHEPPATYAKGSLAIKQGLASLEMDMEIYGVEEGDEIAVYTYVDGVWEREASDQGEDVLDENVFKELLKVHDAFEMNEDTVEVEGKECLEMKGKVEAGILEPILGEGLIDMLDSGAGLLEDAEDNGKVACTVAVYKDTILPARISVDMEDLYIDVVYKEYNKVEKIKVPEEALKAAGTSENKEDMKEDEEKEEDRKESKNNAEAQNEKLGDSWESYTVQINDKVVTFPCTLEEIEAAGLTLDSDDKPYDYIINAGKDEMTFFEDKDGASVMIFMINRTDAPCKLEECLVGGLTINEYFLEDSELSIVFPGGITIGASSDAALSAYGEPEYKDEEEEYKSYMWYEEDTAASDNMCYLDFDPETDKVISMSISCYE